MGQPAPKRSLAEEKDLFMRLKTDPEAIGEVYDLYAGPIFGFCMKRCGDKEISEDLIQQTFVKLIESIPTLEWRGIRLGAWLYTTAGNGLIDHFRKASTRRDTDLESEEWNLPSDDDPEWNAELSMTSEEIQSKLKEMSERDQRIINLKFFAGLEIKEIAKEMDVEANHASVLLYRALGRLRQAVIRPADQTRA